MCKSECEYCDENNIGYCSGGDWIIYDEKLGKYFLVGEHYKNEKFKLEAKYCLECGRKLDKK